MGMPQIPENFNRPSRDETIIDLLESIALDHLALSHIMNAEGEKLQEMLSKFACDEISYHQLRSSCKSTHALMNSMIMKEWLLTNRLLCIMEINDKLPEGPNPPPPPPCK